MKHFLLSLTLSMVGLSLFAQEGPSNNPYGLDDETTAMYYRAIEAFGDSASFAIITDSIEAGGLAENNLKKLVLYHELMAQFGFIHDIEPMVNTHIDKAVEYAKQWMEGKPEQDQFSMRAACFSLLNNRAVFYLNQNNTRKSIELAQANLAEAKTYGNPIFLFDCYMNMGQIYQATNNYQLAIEQFQQVTDLMEETEKAGSLNFPVDRHLIVDIQMALAYHYIHQYDLCDKYLDKALQIDANAIEVPYYRALRCLNSGDKKGFKKYYDEACAMGMSMTGSTQQYRPKLEIMNAAASNHVDEAIMMAEGMYPPGEELMSMKLSIYKWAGNYKEALVLSEQLKVITDSLNQENNQQAVAEMTAEMRTIYDTALKEKQILRQQYTLYIEAILLVAFLLIVAIVIYRNIEIRKKNKALVANINEILDMRRKEKALALQSMQTATESKSSSEEESALSIVQQYIFEMTSKNLFCDSNFDRNQLLDQMHIQKTGFWKLFEEETGTTAPKYILDLRMEYAAEQIRLHPEFTIEAIAADCGIPSRTTFYRNFTNRFGITPNIFREQCEKFKD